PTSAAIAATPTIAARIGKPFIRALRELLRPASRQPRGASLRLAQEAADQANEARHHHRAQQAGIVTGKTPLVFLEADVDQRRRREIDIGHRLAAGEREIVVLRRLRLARADTARQTDALPHQEDPYRDDLGPEPR